MHAASVQKPSNVVVFFSVTEPGGKPAGGLMADAFRIYEDEGFISPFESKQTILNPEVAVSHHALLLIDLSGSITESGSTPELIRASSSFADRMLRSGHTELAVYGFDGAADLHRVVDFTKNSARVRSSIESLSGFKPRDPSTNLNGAVVKGLQMLEKKAATGKQPIRFATLVVFTDGTDRAHRVTAAQMYNALRDAAVNVYAIGVGQEISPGDLSQLGTSGYAKANDPTRLAAAFEKIAAEIEGEARKFYLFSYCSPARAGKHTLRIEANKGDLRGSLRYDFDAEGFRAPCDPNQKPSFSIERVLFEERRRESTQRDKADSK